ncbi:hypothetical protein BTHE68_72370 (plasmid) [Burkholderia sp. THE68]|nr:hypothetical protein BTHE68_72370 [Burkholderia sp. THE68]
MCSAAIVERVLLDGARKLRAQLESDFFERVRNAELSFERAGDAVATISGGVDDYQSYAGGARCLSDLCGEFAELSR